MPEPLRTGEHFWELMKVLSSAAKPMTSGEAVAAVADVVALNDDELARASNGTPRWEVALRWSSGDAAAAGWLVKQDNQWSITEAGRAAVADAGEPGELRRRLNKLRDQTQAARKAAVQAYGADLERIEAAVAAVPAGRWATHGDLALLFGGTAEEIGDLLAGHKIDGAHRILTDAGQVPPARQQHFRYRGGDLQGILTREGLAFHDGVADAGRRFDSDDIAAALTADAAEAPEVRDGARGRRAWLVRGSNVDGVDLIPQWLTDGTCSLAATQLPELPVDVTADQLHEAVEQGYRHKPYSVRERLAVAFDAFWRLMRPGDYLLTTHRGAIHLGFVDGPAARVDSGESARLVRSVVWLNPDAGVDIAELSAPLTALIQSQDDVIDLTDGLDAIGRLYAPYEHSEAAAPPAVAELGPVADDLADKLLLDHDWLVGVRDLLAERRQIILYGPPGTGKTFLAQHLAAAVTEPHAVRLVQFHPSYTYEDFFEGFRPAAGKDGLLRFTLTPGPLRSLADEAHEHPDTSYVLIIDEINRGNLAKIFGELYFLLEYRDHRIRLQYSAEDFTLPPNVYVIGTMNTADRSIALIDAAMRRRFAFVELHPAKHPIAGLLRRWLSRHNLPQAGADLLDALNSRLTDADYAIGPSYLMRPGAHSEPDALDRVWRYDILPLLAEHHYGDDTDVETRYRLESLANKPAPS